MAKAKLKGIHSVQQGIQQFVKQANEGTVLVTEDTARKILADAVENLKNEAFDTGALASSGVVSTTTKSRGIAMQTTSLISFGGKPGKPGPNKGLWDGNPRNLNTEGVVDYAAAVHELNTPYLLNAIRANQDLLKTNMQKQFKFLTRKGGSAAKARTTTPSVDT